MLVLHCARSHARGRARSFTLAEATGLFREAPLDGLAPVDAEPLGESLGEVEVASTPNRTVLDDLGADLPTPESDDEIDAAGQNGMGDPD